MAINGINPNAAASAYASSQSITGGSGQVTNNIGKAATGLGNITAGQDDGGVEVSFADFMKQNIEKSVDTMESGEEMAAKAVTGEADLTDVVQAVTAAEVTLQTVVSVRDRMISAYQEVMRMPI